MPTNTYDDRWLLPRRQTDYPTRDLIAEAVLHGRREATYLALAAVFLIATVALLALGTSRLIDLSSLISTVVPDLELPVAMVLPFGVVPFALSFVAIALVCELYGRRRATALVWVGLVATLALVGLMRLADVVDGHDAFAGSLALAGCCVVAHTCHVLVFDAMRRRTRGRLLWLRLTGSSLIAQLVGWTAFAFALAAQTDATAVTALAVGAAAYTIACVVVLGVPAIIAAHGLALFLRIGRHQPPHLDDDRVATARPALAEGSVARRLPPAMIVDEGPDDQPVEPPRRRSARASIQPYSSAELRFFTEGDELTESPTAE